EIPRCANECRGRCTRLRSAIECDVEILRGFGGSKPLALRALRFDQILEDPSRIEIRIALHQIAPHREIGIARDRWQAEAAIGFFLAPLCNHNALTELRDVLI